MNATELNDSNPSLPGGPEIFIKFRESCVLSALSAAQQEQLFDWLELYPPKIVLEMVAAPPPDGFGLKTHLTSLRRFHERAGTPRTTICVPNTNRSSLSNIVIPKKHQGLNFEQEQRERTEGRILSEKCGHKYGKGNGELEQMPIECPGLRSTFPGLDPYVSDPIFLTSSGNTQRNQAT
ncbi:MAG: hypothetical protein JWM99_3636 [Verrucomicrobiales bacterium]|nr:hypothetical protein [Verrucomicrobiales bacterium]